MVGDEEIHATDELLVALDVLLHHLLEIPVEQDLTQQLERQPASSPTRVTRCCCQGPNP
jgi:hypothetical protein